MIGDRWGVTDAEVARRYPCDDLVSEPAMAAWRAVDIAAAPARVWPWVVQIRLAPYSYDWIDNLGRRSPRELRGLPDPHPRDPFTAAAGVPIGHVVSAEPGRHVTGTIAGIGISYVLEPDGAGTRLLMKLIGIRVPLLGPLLTVCDLVMARRQLLNIKQLAEQATPEGPIRSARSAVHDQHVGGGPTTNR